MNFAFSEEQEELRATLRRFSEAHWPIAETRRQIESASGFDPALWQRLAGELGLAGLTVSELHGGQGATRQELGIALEELGRELAGGPLFATTCLGIAALQNAATEREQAELLPRLASGQAIATLALEEDAGAPRADGVACEAVRDGAGYRLSGAKPFVLDAQNATLLLVAAREPGTRGAQGIGLFAVEAGAEGLAISPAASLDLTRRFAHVALERAPARKLGVEASAWPSLEKTLQQAVVSLASEQVGAAARCLETAVAHAKERIQFGRPIGSFQAVKHRAADAYMGLELARSAAYWASWVAAQDAGDLARAAHVAKSLCADAFARCAAENIHLHGGMGFTWEHDAHLYYRRARADETLFGSVAHHRAELARSLGALA